MVERNAGVAPDKRIEFRVGIHLGDVVEETDGDLMGDGVNIAARLEGICKAGRVCLSGAAYEQVRDRLRETFIDLGEQALKNIGRPVRAYEVTLERGVAQSGFGVAEKPPRLSLPDKPAIAVLPFTNMSGEPEQEYFSDGISEDIITALSKLRWFFVIARNSSFTYKGKAVHMKQVAEELGVGYVLEGSVRKGGDRVRITAQLNEAATGSHIWAERYDRALADVFAVQDEITEAIVAAIEPQLYAAENFRAQRKPPDSMDAWDLVMRALSHYWRVTRQDNVVAQALLEKAIAIDPNYGQALGLLAASHIFCAHMGWVDKAAWRRRPSARPSPPSGSTARTLGRTSRWGGPSFCAAVRRLARRVGVRLAPQSEFLAVARVLWPSPFLLRALGGRRLGRASRAAVEPARPAFGDLSWRRRLRGVRRTQLR